MKRSFRTAAASWRSRGPQARGRSPPPRRQPPRPPPRDREWPASTAAARRYGRTGQNGTRRPRPDDLDIVADVELGVTNRMEYRSAHGAPPISGEFSSDPLKSRTGYSHTAQAAGGQVRSKSRRRRATRSSATRHSADTRG